MIKQLKFLLSLFFVGVTALSLASCSSDDDDDFGGNCEICSYHTLNSKCTINGQGFHCSTSMAQFLSYARGSYLEIQVHQDNGGAMDYHNIGLNISTTTGPSIDNIKEGQSLKFDNGTDKIMCWYTNYKDNYEEVTYSKYISGTVTCTKKNGTETTLSFSNVVVQNEKDGTKETINGTFICDQYRF